MLQLNRSMVGAGIAALSLNAGAQGFIRHFDPQQMGRGGRVSSIREVPGGYLLFCEQRSSDGTGDDHLFTRLLDAAGEQVVEREFGYGTGRDFILGTLPIDPIASSAKGGYAAAVWGGADDGCQGIELFTFDAFGDTTATHTVLCYPLADSISLGAHHARQCDDGGFFIVGGIYDAQAEPSHGRALLLRTDALGSLLWYAQFLTASPMGFDAFGVVEDSAGGAVVIGSRSQGFIADNFMLTRLSATGQVSWVRYFGNTAPAHAGAVRLDDQGNIITFTPYREQGFPTAYFAQFMLTKWSPEGDIIWQKKSHLGSYWWYGDFEVLPDNSIIAVGSQTGGARLMRFSAEGDSSWTRVHVAFATSETHRLVDVEPTSDGGFVAAGSCNQYWGDPTPNLETEWMIKTDSMGCVVPGCQYVGVHEVVVDLQGHLRIAPNPTSHLLQAQLALPAGFLQQGATRAVLLNAQGQEVRAWPIARNGDELLVKEDISALPSGVYYLHIADAKRWLAGGKVVVE